MEEGQSAPTVSRRIEATDTPVIAFTRRVMALRPGALSLAQGIVYWGPPPEATDQLAAALAGAGPPGMQPLHAYSPIEGLPELRAALKGKLAQRNGLQQYDVLVTPGANQAFVDVMLVLNDAPATRGSGQAAVQRSGVVLFPPYYFDFHMALTMTGSACDIVLGQADPATLKPSLPWLRDALAGRVPGVAPPRMVVVVNPCNPTGVVLSRQELDALSQVCREGGAWLVLDNTYEDFVFADCEPEPGAAAAAAGAGGAHSAASVRQDQRQDQGAAEHAAPSSASTSGADPWYCPSGPHVLHIFSFSKAYGLMGWRVGYIAYPNMDGQDALGQQLRKTLDATTICAPVAGQLLALASLRHGARYVREKVASLAPNRALLRGALSVLEPECPVHGGGGALYLWAQLPAACGGDDMAAVEWLVKHAGVCVVPGSAFGMPGHMRCSYANLHPDAFPEAAARLKAGLTYLTQHGMTPPPQPLVYD